VHLRPLNYTCWLQENVTVLAFLQRCSSVGRCQIKFMVYLQFVVQYRMLFPPLLFYLVMLHFISSYLQNGNILAARTFIKHFTAGVPSSLRLDSDSVISVGEKDEVVMTKDSLVNFAQMAVLTCQRAQGDQNKLMRESWVRLCGTYQGRITQLATPEMRSVGFFFFLKFGHGQSTWSFLVSKWNSYPIFRHSASS